MPDSAVPTAPTAPVVVPALQQWTAGEGNFTLREGFTVVWHSPELVATAEILLAEIAELTGLAGAARAASHISGDIELMLDPALAFDAAPATTAGEGYVLEVSAGVVLKSQTSQGVFWATRSLLQMLAASTELPQGTARDWPNYPVRGFMLDVGRRFSETGYLHDLVRYMSWYKMNTFMVHLNDNEITKDTKRAWSEAKQAFRLHSEIPKFAGLVARDGSYSRAEWDALEDLGARYHVRLVPEIDVPAHSRSLIAWRPELGLNGGDSDMLDLSKPETTELVKDIFTEFVPWFRSPIVNFGADEYSREHPEVYREFYNAISAHIRSLGKDAMAWGSLSMMSPEGRAVGFDRDVTVCSWNNGWYGGADAIADGYNIINMNDALMYIVPFADYYHGGPLDAQPLFEQWEPHVFGGDQDVPAGHPQLLGGASALWNDLVLNDYNEHHMHQRIVPAFAVLAHKMWRGAVAGQDFAAFSADAESVAAWPGRTFLAG